MPEIKTLLIRDLDDSFQIRKTTHEDAIDQYAEKMLESGGWGKFPPIDVVFVDGKYKIADGIHRFNAAKRAGLESVPCVVTQGTKLDLLRGSLVKNRRQGIGWPPSDSHHATRTVLKMYAAGDLGNLTKEELADLADCNERTIRRNIKKMEEEGWTFPETVIGKDGKEYHFQKKTGPDMSEPEKPATPAIPHEYCAGGCGTPIWDDIKEAKDCAYVQWDGKWFCSEECAQSYLAKQPEPQEPQDEYDDEYEDEEPVYVTCPKCGKRELEKNLHRAGWIHEKEEGHYGKDLWYCSEECRDWMKGLMDESWKTEEPPAREPAPSSSQASGAEPEQEEPEEFAFTDVDEETLPVCTEEKPEATKCRLRVIYDVESEITDPAEVLRQLGLHSPFTFTSSYIPSIRITLAGLYENINQSLNNNININPATFTEFYICCKGKKGPVKVFISRKKYDEWKKNFGPAFDIDANLDECCKYYNELTGSEMLSAGGVYSKVYAWLLKNWKAQKKEDSKPKKNAYKDAGLRFDPSIY